MLLSVSREFTLRQKQPSVPDQSITADTGGYSLSRVMGNKHQVGGWGGAHHHILVHLQQELQSDLRIVLESFTHFSEKLKLLQIRSSLSFKETKVVSSLKLLFPKTWINKVKFSNSLADKNNLFLKSDFQIIEVADKHSHQRRHKHVWELTTENKKFRYKTHFKKKANK